ncbi:MAG: hypothetical protein H0X51_10105 [Parachlamydiaceae bacterium]|nr:hypothetical protein [Parachlamydiaceae bacterium]
MSSNLSQLQMNYNQQQDRLTLILHTQDFCEYRFWLTRRATKALWEILVQLLDKTPVQHSQEQQKIGEQIQREKEQRHAAAEKYGTHVSRCPLGEEPLLLTKFMAKPADNGVSFLHLEDAQGRCIEFGGDNTIIMALCQLISRSAKLADWDLHLTMDT